MIDHTNGPFLSKSWKKLAPKLAQTRHTPRDTDSFSDRMKVNYSQWRTKAGYQSKDHRLLTRGTKSWEKSDDKLKDFHIASNKKQLAELPARGKRFKDAAKAAAEGSANSRRGERFLP